MTPTATSGCSGPAYPYHLDHLTDAQLYRRVDAGAFCLDQALDGRVRPGDDPWFPEERFGAELVADLKREADPEYARAVCVPCEVQRSHPGVAAVQARLFELGIDATRGDAIYYSDKII